MMCIEKTTMKERTTISNAMTLYRVDSYIINIVTGIILLLAFSLNPIMQIVNERKNKADARKSRTGGKA